MVAIANKVQAHDLSFQIDQTTLCPRTSMIRTSDFSCVCGRRETHVSSYRTGDQVCYNHIRRRIHLVGAFSS